MAKRKKIEAVLAWLPIEMAPKDGTIIAVAEFHDGRWSFWQDYWRKYKGDWGEGFGRAGFTPTHWTHLPGIPEMPARGRLLAAAKGGG